MVILLNRSGGWHLGGIGPAMLFTIAQLEQKGKLRERLIHLPVALLMAVGISLDAFAGVMSGFFQKGGEFVRTPRVIRKSPKCRKG